MISLLMLPITGFGQILGLLGFTLESHDPVARLGPAGMVEALQLSGLKLDDLIGAIPDDFLVVSHAVYRSDFDHLVFSGDFLTLISIPSGDRLENAANNPQYMEFLLE